MSRVPNGTPWNTWGTFENDLDHTRLTPAMLHAYKVFLATAYPQSELVSTMKHLLACLAFCASLSASAQDDNCTVLGVQELSSLYSQLSSSIDTIVAALSDLSDSHSSPSTTEVHPTTYLNTYFVECWITCKNLGPEWGMLSLQSVYDFGPEVQASIGWGLAFNSESYIWVDNGIYTRLTRSGDGSNNNTEYLSFVTTNTRGRSKCMCDRKVTSGQ